LLNAIEQFKLLQMHCLWIPKKKCRVAACRFLWLFCSTQHEYYKLRRESKSCTCFDVVAECVSVDSSRCKTGGFSTRQGGGGESEGERRLLLLLLVIASGVADAARQWLQVAPQPALGRQWHAESLLLPFVPGHGKPPAAARQWRSVSR